MKKPDKILIWFHDVEYGINKGERYANVCFSDQRHRDTSYKVKEIQRSPKGEIWFLELERE